MFTLTAIEFGLFIIIACIIMYVVGVYAQWYVGNTVRMNECTTMDLVDQVHVSFAPYWAHTNSYGYVGGGCAYTYSGIREAVDAQEWAQYRLCVWEQAVEEGDTTTMRTLLPMM